MRGAEDADARYDSRIAKGTGGLVGSSLAHYKITALLGAGGMGEVYRAHDPKLGRDVAIKVLPEAVAKDAEALQRFEHEARAVAALSHPNIRGIHDLDRHGELVFAVMELLEGEPLRARLLEGALPHRVALDYALQTARGLSAAHEKGIVHRDLKPENLFVTRDGFVKILDFGLAKQHAVPAADEETSAPTRSASPGHGAPGTAPGVVMGTLDYMSPEQVRGQLVDHRSDIFSFGAVLHEMLTGKKAFHRGSAADTMAAITRDEPSDAAALPAGVDQIVRHCLEKKPEDRFQSAKDIAFDLTQAASGPLASRSVAAAPARRPRPALLIGAAVLLAVAAAVGVLVARRRGPAPASAPKRIAVLPFENLGTPDQDYFADGVTDEVRGKLTSLASLAVIARGSSTPYRKTTKTPQQIAKELDVAYLLTGTIRWEKAGAGRVQVTPELVEMKEKGAPESRWQQRFEAETTDVFKVQSEIASRVANELGVALGGTDEKRLSAKPTTNLEAYDEFLKGEDASAAMVRIDPLSVRRALAHYERAVALDPSFAVAWSRVSRCRSVLYSNGTPDVALGAAARVAAEKAIALAPQRPDGYVALSVYHRIIDDDARRAFEDVQKALRLAPTDPTAQGMSAAAQIALGRWEAAAGELAVLVRADPLSSSGYRRFGLVLLRLRRLAEARDALDRALALAPANVNTLETRAMVSLAEGDLPGARAVIRGAPNEIDPKALVAYFAQYWELAWVLEPAQRALLLKTTPADFADDEGTWALYVALEYAQEGKQAEARPLAEKAAREFARQAAAVPTDAQRHSLVGFALALAGRKEEAIAEGLRGVELMPIAKDAYNGPYLQHLLVRIYILAGEHEKALDTLEPLLKMPYYLTPAWLGIDPTFDPLRSNPRFQRLEKAP